MCLVGSLALVGRAQDPFWGLTQPNSASIRLEPTVAVGVNRIVQTGNHRIICYNRSGVEQWRALTNNAIEDSSWSSNYFWSGFAGVGGVDARILYDQFNKRFIFMTMQPSPAYLYLAISKGYDENTRPNDPLTFDTAWDKFYIQTKLCDPNNPNNCTDIQFDFPGLGLTDQALYLTALQSLQSGGGGHSLHMFRAPWTGTGNYNNLDLPTAGSDLLMNHFQKFPMPAHFFGSMSVETMYLVQLWKRQDTDGNGKLRLTAITNPFSQPPTKQEFILSVPPYETIGSTSLVQLCPTDKGIAPSQGNIQNVVWRPDGTNGKLYFTHEVRLDSLTANDRFAVRWYEVNLRGWPQTLSPGPTIVQAGLLDGGRVFINDDPADDRPVHYIYPLIMPLESGDITLFLTQTYARSYPELRWTARRVNAGDPTHQMGAPLALMKAGTAGVQNAHQWGEYQGIALDPANGNRAWATGELGRCPSPPCSECSGGGVYQSTFHSAVGSYQAPQTAAQTMTLQVQGVGASTTVHVKLMPPDMGALADAALQPGQTATRKYPHGTSVTLRAPRDEDVPGYDFSHWTINGLQISPPPGEPRQLTLVILGTRNVVAVYQAE